MFIVSCKTRSHLQTSQTTHKPAKASTNHSKTSQTTHKPAKYWTNHPKTSQLLAENQFFYIIKNFSNNAKHVLNLPLFYSIPSTLSSKDHSEVGIEGGMGVG